MVPDLQRPWPPGIPDLDLARCFILHLLSTLTVPNGFPMQTEHCFPTIFWLSLKPEAAALYWIHCVTLHHAHLLLQVFLLRKLHYECHWSKEAECKLSSTISTSNLTTFIMPKNTWRIKFAGNKQMIMRPGKNSHTKLTVRAQTFMSYWCSPIASKSALCTLKTHKAACRSTRWGVKCTAGHDLFTSSSLCGFLAEIFDGIKKQSGLKRKSQERRSLLLLWHGCTPSKAEAHLTINHMLRLL